MHAEHDDLDDPSGEIRIKLVDFSSGGANWTMSASHMDGSKFTEQLLAMASDLDRRSGPVKRCFRGCFDWVGDFREPARGRRHFNDA